MIGRSRGSWPSIETARNNAIKRLYFDARTQDELDDDRIEAIDAGFLSAYRDKGVQVGLQFDPTWWKPVLSARELAEYASEALVRLKTTAKQCACMFDIELHDSLYVRNWLLEWRKLRPTRDTQWSMEPMQGGWMDKILVGAVNADVHLGVIVQLYLGKPRMAPVSERAAVDDLAAVKILRSKIESFYDAERGLPAYWRGVAYNFDALS